MLGKIGIVKVKFSIKVISSPTSVLQGIVEDLKVTYLFTLFYRKVKSTDFYFGGLTFQFYRGYLIGT